MKPEAIQLNKEVEARAARARIVGGYLEVEGRKVNLSYSLIDTFRDCKRKAYYDKIAPYGTRKPRPAAQRGTRVHALLEYRGKHGEWPAAGWTCNVDGERQAPLPMDFALAQEAERFVLTGPEIRHEGFGRVERFYEGEITMDYVGKIDVSDRGASLAALLKREPAAGLISLDTPTILDWKTRRDMTYAPGEHDIKNNVQTLSYAYTEFHKDRHPPDYVNVAQVNILTDGITASAVGACSTWAKAEGAMKRIREDARTLERVLLTKKIDDVPGTQAACGKYGGCAYKEICSASPVNASSQGRLGALMGIFNNKPEPKKTESTMAKIDLKAAAAARKARLAGAPTPTAKATPAPAPAAKAPGTPRVVAADAGPAKDAKGAPLVTPGLLKDVQRAVRQACRENGLEVSIEIIQMACREVGLDFEAAKEDLAAFYDDIDFDGVGGPPEDEDEDDEDDEDGDEADEDGDEDDEDGDEDDEDGWVWEPLQEYPYTQAVHEINVIASGHDGAAAAALLSLWSQAKDGPVKRRDALLIAKAAYNGAANTYPDLDYTESQKEIQRFTVPKFNEIANLAPGVVAYDEGEDVIYRVEDPEGGEAETAEEAPEVEAPEAPPVKAQKAPKDLTTEIAAARAETEAAIQEAAARLEAATRPDDLTPEPRGDSTPVVCIGARPVGGVQVVEYPEWIADAIIEVEATNGVAHYTLIDFGRGPGTVAAEVARRLAKGEMILPDFLVVDRFHPTWQAVRDVLVHYRPIFIVASN